MVGLYMPTGNHPLLELWQLLCWRCVPLLVTTPTSSRHPCRDTFYRGVEESGRAEENYSLS